MAQLIDATRIANEPTLRYTAGDNSSAVINLSLPCDYGRKGADGKKPTQWVDASLWGKQAEALAPYLLKGQFVAFTLDDVHIEEFQSNGGTKSKLVGRVSNIKLIGSSGQNSQSGQQSGQSSQKPAQATQTAAPATGGWDDTDMDIPFAPYMHGEY